MYILHFSFYQIPLIRREASSGISVTAYALGRILLDLLFVFWNAMIFAGIWLLFGHAGKWSDWLIVIVCTSFASSGVGYLSAVIMRPGFASFTAIVSIFVFSVFSGTEPKLKQVQNLAIVNWLWYISFATHTSQASYYTWSKYLDNDGKIPNRAQVLQGARAFGFNVETLGPSIGALLVIGISFRIITIFILWIKSKPRAYYKGKVDKNRSSSSKK